MNEAIPGDRLGKYEVRRILGKGAMGVVYDGWDPAIDRRVAIKTVRLPDAHDPEAQEGLARFKREAQAAGRLNHPNIVGVFDYGETGELAYIVMEFVEGRTLADMMKGDERLPFAETLRVMDDILAGLVYSHGRGVVHRDIKPANVMITGEGRAKIADFGIARIESSSMTQAGTLLGTPAYMSPEQFMGQVVDRRTDIYSCGVLLYQLLTGDRPFDGTSLTTIMHKALNTVPPSPSSLSVTAPPGLDAVVARAMARRPEDRYPGAGEFAQALREGAVAGAVTDDPGAADATIIANRTAITPPAPPPPASTPSAPAGRSRAVPMAAGGVALLAVAGVAAWVLLPSKPAPVIVASETRPVAPGPIALPPPPSSPPSSSTPPSSNPSSSTPASSTPASSNPPSPIPLPASVPPPLVQPTGPLITPLQASQPAPYVTTQPAPAPASSTPAPAQPAPAQVAPSPAIVPLPASNASVPPPQITPPAQPATRPAAAVRAALAAVIPDLRCTLATAAVSDAGVATITGLTGVGDPEAALHRAVATAAPSAADWRVTAFDGPYCPALDVLRPLAIRPGAASTRMDLSLSGGAGALSDNQVIPLAVVMPDFAGHLQVDYLQHDGTVAHLSPAAAYPDRTYRAGAHVELGRPRADFEGWKVGPPFGTDMIVAIVSTAPLFPRPRTDGEATDAYLRDLQAAMDNLRRRGGNLAAAAVVLETRP